MYREISLYKGEIPLCMGKLREFTKINRNLPTIIGNLPVQWGISPCIGGNPLHTGKIPYYVGKSPIIWVNYYI